MNQRNIAQYFLYNNFGWCNRVCYLWVNLLFESTLSSKISWSELNSEGTRLFGYSRSRTGPSPFYNTLVDKYGKCCKQRNYSMASVFVASKNYTWNSRKVIPRNEVWDRNSRKFVPAKHEKSSNSNSRENFMPQDSQRKSIMKTYWVFLWIVIYPIDCLIHFIVVPRIT